MANLLKRIILGLAMLAIPAGPIVARADSAANARAEAKKHYDRAMELNEDGQTAEAVIELKRAYELAPHHTVLYNLGQAYITLAKPVDAVAALQRYLHEGGKAIKPDRRAEVEQEIARQKTRIATLEIRVLPEGAAVTIDGDDLGRAPLAAPVHVGVGKHVVAATAAGYEPGEARIEVAGEDNRVVELKLAPRAGQPPVAAVVGAGAGHGKLRATPAAAAPGPAPASAATAPTPAPTPVPALVPVSPPAVPTPAPAPPTAEPLPAAASDALPNPFASAQPASGASLPPAQGQVAASAETSKGSGLLTAGIVAASVGAFGLVTGAILWEVAKSKNDDAASQWQARNQSQARSTRSDAEGLATGANVCLIAGGVLAGVGVITTLFTLGKDSPSKSVALAPAVGPSFAGLEMKGNW